MKTWIQWPLLALLLVVTANAQAANFAGRWNTIWGNGTATTNMTMTQHGNQVAGNYAYRGGAIVGVVSANVLRGSWAQNDGARGTFEFRLSPDGQSFQGRWRNGTSGPWAADSWNGVRQ